MIKLPLTQKEREIYDFILGFDQAHGYMPTMKEISIAFRRPARSSSVQREIKNIINKGKLERGKGWRSLRLPKEQ